MSDIVEELRLLESGAQWVCGQTAATLSTGADEIEKLRAERDMLRAALQTARRDALEEAVKRLEELHRNHGYDSATGLVMRQGQVVTNSGVINHALGYYRAISEGAAHIRALGEKE